MSWGMYNALVVSIRRLNSLARCELNCPVNASSSDGLPVTMVMPGLPFGPGDRAPTPTGTMILRTLQGKMKNYWDGGVCAVDVRDVAAGHVLAMEKGRIGESYILANKAGNMTNKEMLTLIGKVAGVADVDATHEKRSRNAGLERGPAPDLDGHQLLVGAPVEELLAVASPPRRQLHQRRAERVPEAARRAGSLARVGDVGAAGARRESVLPGRLAALGCVSVAVGVSPREGAGGGGRQSVVPGVRWDRPCAGRPPAVRSRGGPWRPTRASPCPSTGRFEPCPSRWRAAAPPTPRALFACDHAI